MRRREFSRQMLALLVSMGIVGCTSSAIRRESYKESVSSVLISADGKSLVVMTQNFHYIFKTTPTLVQALKGSFHEFLVARFSDFRVVASGGITGNVSLGLLASAPDDAVEDAVKAGFSRTPKGALFVSRLEGMRYQPGEIQPLETYKLNQSYEIEVLSEQRVETVTMTPVHLIGGVLAVAGVALFALTTVTRCTATGNLKNCHE